MISYTSILGLGNAADAIEILSIGYILAVYQDHEGRLTRTEQSVLAAAIFAGMFVGGLLFGILSDQIGRRASLLYSIFLNAVFALLSSVTPNIHTLIFCRTMAGVGIGGTVPAMFTLCSEHVPPHRRGFYVTIVASYWMVGSVFTAALAWIMLGHSSTKVSWRIFAAVVSLPAFLCWFLTYRFVPESAQYYARQRNYTLAEETVNHIRTTNASRYKDSEEQHQAYLMHEGTALLSPYRPILTPPGASLVIADALVGVEHERSILESYRQLFDPVLRTTTISLFLSWVCLSFGSYGLATWITVLFQRINLAGPFANAFIYAAANLPGNLFSALLMDKWGGRKVLFVSMLLSASCAAGFAYVSSSTSSTLTEAALIILLASGFNAFSTAGWNAIDLMSAESFPTDIRTTGMGLLAAGGRSGSVIAQFVNGYLVGPPPRITLLLSVTAIMMMMGSISSVLGRDFSGKQMPASINEMRVLFDKRRQEHDEEDE